MSGIDFSPLVPAINGLIQAVAGIIVIATPVLVFYAGIWLRNHGIASKQAALQTVSNRISATVQNGLKYSSTGADDGVNKLTIPVSDPKVAAAANYAILQSPDLLKQGGIDVSTTEGQQALVRRVTAASAPPLPSAPPTLDVTLTEKQPWNTISKPVRTLPKWTSQWMGKAALPAS
jgi:hypothetical protein